MKLSRAWLGWTTVAGYDPAEMIGTAKDLGLYTITRIVTFEDKIWAREIPDHKLAGRWIDPTLEDAWEYPLQLAVEACELGFDEIQFDHVSYPFGGDVSTATFDGSYNQEVRVASIAAFLERATAALHPNCTVSTTILGIVLGGLSGYYGGTTDMIIQRLIELLQSLPAVPIWLALSAAMPNRFASRRPQARSSPEAL